MQPVNITLNGNENHRIINEQDYKSPLLERLQKFGIRKFVIRLTRICDLYLSECLKEERKREGWESWKERQ